MNGSGNTSIGGWRKILVMLGVFALTLTVSTCPHCVFGQAEASSVPDCHQEANSSPYSQAPEDKCGMGIDNSTNGIIFSVTPLNTPNLVVFTPLLPSAKTPETTIIRRHTQRYYSKDPIHLVNQVLRA